MLLFDERAPVLAALQAVFLSAGNIRTRVATIFSPDETVVLTEIEEQGAVNARDSAAAVLRACLRERWRHAPASSLLQRLLDELIVLGSPQFAPLRDRIVRHEDPTLDLLDSNWMTADQPFFGRSDTRGRVRELLDKSDRPILVVQGNEHCGKTYTGEWLDYLADPRRCDFRIALETLPRGSGATMAPDLLAESLVTKMGWPRRDLILPPEQPHRWEKKLCNWIIAQALSVPARTVWIVLDGFGDEDLHRGTKTLIQDLAANLLNGEMNRRARLVLLDFSAKLAQVQEQRMCRDVIPDPDSVPADELIKKSLQQHLADTRQPATPAFVDALASQLAADAEQLAGDPRFAAKPTLERLNLVVYNLRQKDLERLRRLG